MADAARFCRAHGMVKADADLVSWLVEHHLVMSSTAQKQDLGDPEVISGFATTVRDERTLTALYILTVADIRGTSPRRVERVEGEAPSRISSATRGACCAARPTTPARGSRPRRKRACDLPPVRARGRQARALWGHLDDNYFQPLRGDEIGWHTRTLWNA
jgi:[protein-PII] uridylyltransferase